MKTLNIYKTKSHAEFISSSINRFRNKFGMTLLFSLLFSVFSCSNLYEDNLKKSPEELLNSTSNNTSQTYLVITPNDVSINSRSIDPNMEDTLGKLSNITLSGKKTSNPDGTAVSETNSSLASAGSLAALYNKQILLEKGAGFYTFELKGSIDSVYFYQKLENVTIEDAKTNSISFTLQPVAGSSDVTTSFGDYGGMHIKLYYSNSVNATYTVKLSVENLTTGEAVETDKPLSPQQTSGVYSATNRYVEYKRWASYSSSSSTPQIATGEYRVTFKFYYGEQLLNSLPYVVHVARGINTVFEDTIDLNEIYKITYNVNQGSQSSGLLEGEVKTEYYTRKSGNIVLYRPYRANYIFDGWYDENDKLITNIPHGSTGNKTVNAHWLDMHEFPSVNKATGSGTTWLVDLYVNPDATYHYGNSEEYGLESIARAIEIIKHTGGTSPAFNIKIKGSLTGANTISTDINSYADYLILEGLSDLIDGIPQDELNGHFTDSNQGTVLSISTRTPVTLKKLKITGGNNSNADTGKGGGIFIGSYTSGSSEVKSQVTLDDGVLISGNSATEGSGIYNEGILNIKGSAIVQTTGADANDIYLAEGKTVNITGELTNPAEKIAIITPATYNQGIDILKATNGIAISDILDKFSLTQKTGEHWEILNDGKLSEGYSTTSSNLNSILSQLNPNTASTPIVIQLTDNASDFATINEDVNSKLDTAGKFVKLSYKNASFTEMAGILSDYVTNLTIPASVTSVGFIDGTNISGFSVAGGNTTYTAENGILYANSGNTIVRYPPATTETTVTIPQNITAISDGAFAGCMNIEKFAVASGNTRFKVPSTDWVTSKEDLTAYQELEYYEPDSTLGDPPEDVFSSEYTAWERKRRNQYGHNGYAPIPVLTSYDGTTLIAYPAAYKLVTPADVEEKYPGGDSSVHYEPYKAYNPAFSYTTVRPYAFGKCDTLTSASVKITSTTATSAYLFYKCPELTYVSLNIPSTDIVAYSFTDCTKLGEVEFSNTSTTKIKTNAFAGCTALKKLWFAAGRGNGSAEAGAYPSSCTVTIDGQVN